ncbi:MAG TPA: hypothetical protein VF648_19725 [Pyrinomonadaceae bacterium]|jgi:hypothetical protein
MSVTKFALLFKITLTFLWFIPLLLFPREWLIGLGMSASSVYEFVRLLGAAFLALLMGYVLGLRDLNKQIYPVNTILVGIASNGLASLILFYFGITKGFNGWTGFGKWWMWASAFLTLLVTALLIAGLIIEATNNRANPGSLR